MYVTNILGVDIKSDFKLGEEQEQALREMAYFLTDEIEGIDDYEYTYALHGYAGTGKTTLTKLILQFLKEAQKHRPIILAAPTHTAKINLKKLSGRHAITVAKLVGLSPNLEIEKVNIKKLLFQKGYGDTMPRDGFVIIDEASMIPDDIYHHILKLAKKYNTKVLFIGDTAQLEPPKQSRISQAFRRDEGISYLTKVHRVKDDNPIAGSILQPIRDSIDAPGDAILYRSVVNKNKEGIMFVDSEEKFLDLFKRAVEKYPDANQMRAVAYTNRRVKQLNTFIRNELNHTQPLEEGESIMFYYNHESLGDGEYRFPNGSFHKILERTEDNGKITLLLETYDDTEYFRKHSATFQVSNFDLKYFKKLNEHKQKAIKLAGQKMYSEAGRTWAKYFDMQDQVFVLDDIYLHKDELYVGIDAILTALRSDPEVTKVSKETAYDYIIKPKSADYAYTTTVHKCLSGTTKVYCSDGIKDIQNISIGDNVDIGNGVYREVTNKFNSGFKNEYTLTTKAGYEIKLSQDHPILMANDSFNLVQDVKVGDKIPIARKVNHITIDTGIKNLAYFLGLAVGDGSYNIRSKSKSRVDIVVSDLDKSNQQFLADFLPKGNFYSKAGKGCKQFVIENETFRSRLLNLGLTYASKQGKVIPKSIFTASLKNKSAFLRGYFDADGSISKTTNIIRLVSVCEHLVKDVQRLLLDFGIISYISVADKETIPLLTDKAYTLNISGINTSLYMKYISFGLPRKKQRYLPEKIKGKSNRDFIPNRKSILSQVKKDLGDKRLNGKGLHIHHKIKSVFEASNLSYRHLHIIKELYELHGKSLPVNLQTILDNNYYYDTVKSIELTNADVPMYDIEVADYHRFKADGFVVHNCQGATVDYVFVDSNDIDQFTDGYTGRHRTRNRLMYVAYSRSSKLTVVLTKKKYVQKKTTKEAI
jgi:intein/homing endonuclease